MNSLRDAHASESGFTLVEVLVALALLATIGAIVFGSLVTTTRVVDAGREHAGKEQMVRRIFRLMADELLVSRSVQQFPWVGVNSMQDGQPADTVAFLALSDGLGRSTGAESETNRVIYTRERDRLLRVTRKNVYGLTDESVEQIELANQVKSFNVRYYDALSRVWTDEWNSPPPKLPKAVLFEITFQPPDADPWTVREWVTIGAS
ncbi:PulJ/GspJ family protein [Nitrospira moscoviensis]|uniref:PulJ/GspJ family protein n=1 Tax=Nitrospira moscoviensis TaxID=42253 RepID=UPI0006A7A9A4|nr:type II secretion system protein GspJ [Nitrospira moscoviensis]